MKNSSFIVVCARNVGTAAMAVLWHKGLCMKASSTLNTPRTMKVTARCYEMGNILGKCFLPFSTIHPYSRCVRPSFCWGFSRTKVWKMLVILTRFSVRPCSFVLPNVEFWNWRLQAVNLKRYRESAREGKERRGIYYDKYDFIIQLHSLSVQLCKMYEYDQLL